MSEAWDIIVITTKNSAWKEFIESECDVYRAKDCLPPHHELIVVEDPSVESSKDSLSVGSGGAVINAILVAAETLSAKRGRSMINGDDLKDSRTLIVSVGRPTSEQSLIHPETELLSSHFDSQNNSVIPERINKRLVWPTTPLLLSLWSAQQLATNFSRGVWISSYDCCLHFNGGISVLPTACVAAESSSVLLFTVMMSGNQAKSHGVVVRAADGHRVKDIIYRPSEELYKQLYSSTGVEVLSGQLYISPVAAEKLLSLHLLAPYTHCTYHATDLGLQPFAVSLYFDLLSCMCDGVTQDAYVNRVNNTYNSLHYGSTQDQYRLLARQTAWDHFSGASLYATTLPDVSFEYIRGSLLPSAPSLTAPVAARWCSGGGVKLINCVIKGVVQFTCSDEHDTHDAVNWGSEQQEGSKNTPTLYDCYVGQNWHVSVGPATVAVGVCLEDTNEPQTVHLGSGLLWQQCRTKRGESSIDEAEEGSIVIVCSGVNDCSNSEYPQGGMFNGLPWTDVLRVFNTTPEVLWPSGRKTVHNARLFPVTGLRAQVSAQEQITDITSKLNLIRRHKTDSLVGSSCSSISDANSQRLFVSHRDLQNDPLALLSYSEYRHELQRRQLQCDIETMDSSDKCLDIKKYLQHWACSERSNLQWTFKYLNQRATEIAENENKYKCANVLITRCLALASDVLCVEAGWHGNIRTGPASNEHFTLAFSLLQTGTLAGAVPLLYKAFTKLCGVTHSNSAAASVTPQLPPSVLTRAARHYQRSVQIMISRVIIESMKPFTSQLFPATLCPSSVPATGVWVEALCPARLDLAGGWTDTPPICYELGGAVLNVAITVNGQKPINIRGRWNISSEGVDGIVCTLVNSKKGKVHGQSISESPDDEQRLRLHWRHLDDLKDYSNPLTPGALIKAALVCSNLVDLKSEEDLQTQLNRYGGGWLELEVHSLLPPGSGLGGSSLIGGALLAVLAELTGRHSNITAQSLVHATLALEQYMTTGGGWQDQIGGLYGGFKLGVSRKTTPVRVESYHVPVSAEFLAQVNRSLLLCYTGQVRLAKNLLQTVISSWYSGDQSLHDAFTGLLCCAREGTNAVLLQDIQELGRVINEYWRIKKTVAPDSEPSRVSELMSRLSGTVCGASLAGAGGGGYLYALLAQEQTSEGSVACVSSVQYNSASGPSEGGSLGSVTFDDAAVDCDGLLMSVGGTQVFKFGPPQQNVTSNQFPAFQ